MRSADGLSCLSITTSSVLHPMESKQSPGYAAISCSSMQGLQGEGRGLCYSGQACCDAPVREVTAQRAGNGSFLL